MLLLCVDCRDVISPRCFFFLLSPSLSLFILFFLFLNFSSETKRKETSRKYKECREKKKNTQHIHTHTHTHTHVGTRYSLSYLASTCSLVAAVSNNQRAHKTQQTPIICQTDVEYLCSLSLYSFSPFKTDVEFFFCRTTAHLLSEREHTLPTLHNNKQTLN